MPDADTLMVERAERDFETGLEHALHLIHLRHNRLVAGTLGGLVHAALRTLDLRHRMGDEVRRILALGHRVAGGEDARAVAEEHLPLLLRRKKVHLVAREGHPEYQAIRGVLLDNFARRLPDLARMVSVPDPATYEDLVRAAFPDKAHVDAILRENAAFVRGIVARIEAHPDVLRIPAGLVPGLAATAREMISWELDRVQQAVDGMYAPAPVYEGT